jgi:DNA-binding MarR family transcriptional regulator
MAKGISNETYRSLAELRYHIRVFLQISDVAAREVGIEPQQYQVLLAIRGLDPGEKSTIRALSERLLLKHHSTVELVDRLEAKGLVVRSRDREDRRQVCVNLRPKGERLLEKVVRKRLGELRTDGRELVKVLQALLDGNGRLKSRPHVAFSIVPGRAPRERATA